MEVFKMTRTVLHPQVLLITATLLIFAVGCLQLESPKTLAEEEDLRVRDKNVTQSREELEEKMRRELDHIRILENSLELTRTREKALTEELNKANAGVQTLENDMKALEERLSGKNKELTDKQKELDQKTAKRQELEESLAAELNRIAATEEILENESKRIEEVWLRISQASRELKTLEGEESRLAQEIKASQELIWRNRKILDEAENALEQDRRALEELKKRIEELLSSGN
jgi:chromosome segregation protein